jgi:hypothetical protein
MIFYQYTTICANASYERFTFGNTFNPKFYQFNGSIVDIIGEFE